MKKEKNSVISRFLSYVEIKTKITSIFAFLMTIAYLFYRHQPVDWMITSIFFGSMFLIDLATTAINNYIDTKTNDQILPFKRGRALCILLLLSGAGAALGLYLVYLTDIVVLLVGGLCFLCGVFYTFGPMPISRLPFGEIISGAFYGLLIPFLILYINMPEGTYIALDFTWERIRIDLNIMPLIAIAIFAAVPACATADIMLANNICDLEKDIKVRRYTLPYFIGDKALLLFAAVYYLAFAAVILMVGMKILAPVCLLFLLTIFIVQKNINQFRKVQDKETTFIAAIKNYIIIMSSITLLIFISGFLS